MPLLNNQTAAQLAHQDNARNTHSDSAILSSDTILQQQQSEYGIQYVSEQPPLMLPVAEVALQELSLDARQPPSTMINTSVYDTVTYVMSSVQAQSMFNSRTTNKSPVYVQAEIDMVNSQNRQFLPHGTVAIAFFLSTETHAKRLLTIWKRSVWTTLKRSFAVLANQIIVSETFQAFRILANQISVRKTLSWKPCLVPNVLSFAS